jgi:hypothetical protein
LNLSSYAGLAVRLASSVPPAGQPDPLGSPGSCAAALRDWPDGPVTRRDLEVLAHVRAELRTVFRAAAAGQDGPAMDCLNALLVQFPVAPELTSHDDQPWHLHLAAHGGYGDRLAAAAVTGLALSVSSAGVRSLGCCAVAACPQVFLAAGAGGARRYCAAHAGRSAVRARRAAAVAG